MHKPSTLLERGGLAGTLACWTRWILTIVSLIHFALSLYQLTLYAETNWVNTVGYELLAASCVSLVVSALAFIFSILSYLCSCGGKASLFLQYSIAFSVASVISAIWVYSLSGPEEETAAIKRFQEYIKERPDKDEVKDFVEKYGNNEDFFANYVSDRTLTYQPIVYLILLVETICTILFVTSSFVANIKIEAMNAK